MGLWLDPQPAALGSRGVYRARGVSEESQLCSHIKPGAAITNRKGRFYNTFIGALMNK